MAAVEADGSAFFPRCGTRVRPALEPELAFDSRQREARVLIKNPNLINQAGTVERNTQAG